MVAAGTPVEQVMAAIFGVVIAGSFIEMGVTWILPWVKQLITPLVTGIVVLLIGLTLIKEGLISMGGGYIFTMQDHTFANTDNLIMSCTVLAVIILLNRVQIIWVKKFSNFNRIGDWLHSCRLYGSFKLFRIARSHLHVPAAAESRCPTALLPYHIPDPALPDLPVPDSADRHFRAHCAFVPHRR